MRIALGTSIWLVGILAIIAIFALRTKYADGDHMAAFAAALVIFAAASIFGWSTGKTKGGKLHLSFICSFTAMAVLLLANLVGWINADVRTYGILAAFFLALYAFIRFR
jgi:FtsH-binding integral membrane protein